MTITLSKTTDEIEKVNKVLTSETPIQCELVNTDILNPILKMKGERLVYNYGYIERFGRYYWVTKYEALPGGYLYVFLEVDPLMSYKNDILQLDVIVNRNKDFPNSKVIDKKIVPNGNSIYSSKTFGGTECRNIRYLLTTK